jgi:hypothetical protein
MSTTPPFRANGHRAVMHAQGTPPNTSLNSPASACACVSRQVTIPSVSNGCGTSEYGDTVAAVLNWFGDTEEYGGVVVDNRLLCNQHDATTAQGS